MRSRAHFRSHPVHPMLIVFPIGLWVASFIFDILGVVLHKNLLRAAEVCAAIGALLES